MSQRRASIKEVRGEVALFRRRALVGFAMLLLGLVAVCSRYVYLQVLHHDEFVARSEQNRIKPRAIPPARGLIYDRNGVLLADNVPAFRLEVTPEQVDNMDDMLNKLGAVVPLSDDDITTFRKQVKLGRRFDGVPLKLKLTEDEIARFAVNRWRFPGVDVVPYLTRRYPLGPLMAHVIGYVSRIDADDLARVDEARYKGTTHIGRTGIERSYEDLLHGAPGYELVEVNVDGRTQAVLDTTPPTPLLRRGLVRSSLAAEGADKAVDQCMKEMREIVRKDDMDAGLAALIPRLEKAVLDSEQRREQRIEQMGTALTSLVTQLQALPLPREVAKPLKRFAKSLEDRVNQAREIPLLLSELSGLQGKALAEIEHPEESARPGFLQRLFGSRDGAEEADAPSTAHPAPEAAKPTPAAKAETHDDHDDEPDAPERGPSKAQWTNEAPPAEVPVVVEKPAAVAVAEAPAAAVIETASPVLEPSAAAIKTDDIAPVAASEPAPVEAVEPRPEPDPVESSAPAVIAEVDAEPAPDTPEEAPLSEEQVIEQAESETPDEPAEDAAEDNPTDDDTSDEAPKTEEAEGTETEEDGPYALPSSPEPSYSSVAAHIEDTLLGLLNDLTLPEHHRPQAEAMRVRLEHGLNWYELLPILDDLAVLMLAITDSGQHEFELYLKQLNERLESFQANLQAASEDHAGQQSASRELNEQLREHVGDLQHSVQEAADLDGLKNVLESRLEGLLGTMDRHQQQRDQREQEVASRLQSLASRVATMEQEAVGFRAHLEEQRQKALIDTLTGLPNRAAWNERLDQEIDQLQKSRSSLLLGILDLDHFKRINDGYGHLAGDKVLKIVATQLKKRLRAADFMARFGGEEFVVLLPHTQMADGLALLERLRQTVEECPFHFKGEPVTITVSMGITTFRPGERSDLVLKRADQALYRAKDLGRNRIEQG